MTLVLDASVVFAACLADDGFDDFTHGSVVAPGLMWSETRSALHVAAWHNRLRRERALVGMRRLHACPVTREEPAELGEEAWRIADELGLATTYDAEYLALARLLGGRVVTLDMRLRRGADRTGLVITPAEM